MFCEKCGTKLRNDAQFCQKCGTPLMKRESVPQVSQEEPPSQTESQPVQKVVYQTVYQPVYHPQPKQYYAPGTHPYHQLGGFLLFHVVVSYISAVLLFIDIITTIISHVSRMKMNAWLPDSFKGFLTFDMIGSVLISFVTGCIAITYANKIRRKESDVLHFIQSSTIVMLIINVIFRSIEFAWLQSIVKQYHYNGAAIKNLSIGTIIFMIVIGAVGLFLGSLYFSRSVRVRTYMGSDDYLRNSLFNKNSVSPIPADGTDQPGVVNPNAAVNFDPKKQWYCIQCGRINENYTTTCSCGKAKPSGASSDIWVCRSCGMYNMGHMDKCEHCGNLKPAEGWTCPKCGSKNRSNEGVCFVCGTTNPSAKKVSSGNTPVKDDWVCPQCGTINADYVGTCGCGHRKC